MDADLLSEDDDDIIADCTQTFEDRKSADPEELTTIGDSDADDSKNVNLTSFSRYESLVCSRVQCGLNITGAQFQHEVSILIRLGSQAGNANDGDDSTDLDVTIVPKGRRSIQKISRSLLKVKV
jgi:hypothetical protein